MIFPICLLGTGKTILGVYIVYRFFVLNSKNQRKFEDPKDENKKQVILYCGPSNKSVDVVAGKCFVSLLKFQLHLFFVTITRVVYAFCFCNTDYLLKFGDSLRPLRVYSQQVEMLDYPYPDCTLQFSQRAVHQERAKPELRYGNHTS